MGWKLLWMGKQTIQTFDSYWRLIPDFQDVKSNRLMHTSYFRLDNRYFKAAKKCHVETFKHGT
jgi:hypothetical protein